MNTRWYPSPERSEWIKTLEAIPWWKMWLYCVWHYSAWSKARALGKAAVYCINMGDYETGCYLVLLADQQWASFLPIPYPRIQRTNDLNPHKGEFITK